jgi:hypothetical protein
VRLVRGVGLTAFYRRPLLARQFPSQVHGMSVEYGGVHVRVRQRHDWDSGGMVSAARPRRAQHVVHGYGAWMAVRRKGGVQGTRTGGPRPGSACGSSERGAADARRRRGRHALERQEPKPNQPNPL